MIPFRIALTLLLALTGADEAPKPTMANADAMLWTALQADDRNRAEAAIDAGADIETRSAEGMTPLLQASIGNGGGVVALLIARGADLDAKDPNDYRPFDLAMERYRLEAVVALLTHWATSPGEPAQRAASQIGLAAAQGDTAAVAAALAAGTPADAMGASGYTALALAARWGRRDVVDLLLGHGASANLATRSRYGSTPLMEAARDGRSEIAERLIAAGANPDAGDRYGDHALNWAAYFGHSAFVALLLKHHPDLKRRGQTDDWPLEIAHREGHAEVAKLLVNAGATARPGK